MKSGKIVIWGINRMGKSIYYGGGLIRAGLELVAFTDADSTMWGKTINNIPVISPEQLTNIDYDYIFVAVNHPTMFEEILSIAKKQGLDTEKLIDTASDPKYLDLFMNNRFAFIKDYARKIYEEKIPGNIAECGVFRGESAKFINFYFPDRKIYLFDTFEGFPEKDLIAEKLLGNDAFNKSIFATSPMFDIADVGYVLKKLTYPENAIIKKGYFPESASGVDDQFVFVSLDMDLYVPMLEGIRFFWPKLMQGGCILLHDYYHPNLPGVAKAVNEFEIEQNIYIRKMPIGDDCSICLIK